MRKHLIIAAFEKARIESKENGTDTEAKTKLATILSEYIFENLKHPIHERSLRDYYSKALVIDGDKDIKIAQQNVINGLCHYVNCDTYQDFLNTYKLQPIGSHIEVTKQPQHVEVLKQFKKHKTAILFLLSTIVLVIFIIKTNQERWMKWNGETYEETNFEPDSLKNGVLLLFSEEQAGHFKKLPKCDCDTDFFNPDGSAKVWYSKNKDKTIDCFNRPGLHPETGKTLKPISTYMIKNYLCKTY